jgi:hypothetical protein
MENQEEYLQYGAMKTWSDLQGTINIYKRRVLFEVSQNDKDHQNRRVNDLINEAIASCTGALPKQHQAQRETNSG